MSSKTEKYGSMWLYTRGKSETWYMRFYNPATGKTEAKTTGTTTLREAKRIADEEGAKLIDRRYSRADGKILLTDLLSRYMEANYVQKPDTLRRIQTSWNMFLPWLKENHPAIKRAKDLTAPVVRSFHRYRGEELDQKRTANNDIKNLTTVFNWGIGEVLIEINPAKYGKKAPIKLYDIPEHQKDVYSHKEVDELLKVAQEKGKTLIRDMITVFADTGLRFQELSHLTAEFLHWNLEIPKIEIKAHDGWSPKDPKEEKMVPMSPRVQEVLRRRESTAEKWLFPSIQGKPISDSTSRDALQALFPYTSIDESRELFWHSFRNYFVKTCIENNIGLHIIMKWTGHDTAKMALHYASVSDEDVDRASKKLFHLEEESSDK